MCLSTRVGVHAQENNRFILCYTVFCSTEAFCLFLVTASVPILYKVVSTSESLLKKGSPKTRDEEA